MTISVNYISNLTIGFSGNDINYALLKLISWYIRRLATPPGKHAFEVSNSF